jgi:hypothetical protein
MILPQGFSDEINGHKIYVNQEENAVYMDKTPLQNAPPNVLSILALRTFLRRATENELIIVEDPEIHLDESEINEVKELLEKTRARVVLVTSNKII